jgi:phosphoglycolate phosphatase-like HAD superfamily hydrolase
VHLAAKRITILFDIDGTLINSGGAGAASWRLAFDELYGIPADIGEFTDAGMTDPDVGRKTFEAVMHRAPERAEFTKLMERRLHYMYETVEDSTTYRRPAGRRGAAATADRRRLPAGARDRKRRGRGAHQAPPGAAQPVLLIRRIRLRLE